MAVEKEAKKNGEVCAGVVTRTTPRFMIASEVLSVLIFLGGCAVLLGWALDIPVLKSISPHFMSMKANLACVFVLSGASLWLLQQKRQEHRFFRKMARVCSAVVLGIGLLTLLEYILAWDFGIDQLLFKEPPGAILTFSPGRMALTAAIGSLFTGLALFLFSTPKKNRCLFAQILILPVGGIALLSLFGYLYHAAAFLIIPHFSVAMAIHAAILFLLIFFALLFCEPGCGLMAPVSSEGVGGQVIRRLLPVTCLLPPFFGWLKLYWIKGGFISDEFGVAFVATANLVSISSFVYILALILNRSDSERKRAEAALHNSEVSYRRLFEAAQDGVLIVDFESGTILDVNPFLIDLLGYSKGEFLEKQLWDVGVFKDVFASKEAFLKLQTEGYVRFENLPLETKSGQKAEVEFVSNVYLVDHRKVVQCNIRDITARRKAEAETRAALKIKSDFLSMVSHEVRSPLAAIKESLGLLGEESFGAIPQEQKSLLDIAKRNVERLSRLVNDVLDLQKIDSGKMELNVLEHDMNVVAQEAGKVMRFLAEQKGQELVVDLDRGLPRMKFDGDKIMQVFINLLSNAIKFSEKGSIVLRMRKENNTAHVTVSDNGPGIRDEDLPKIFQAFEQLKGSRKGGTGLGLAICKEIVLLHHGKIWVESEVGRGATFHVILPIQEHRG